MSTIIDIHIIVEKYLMVKLWNESKANPCIETDKLILVRVGERGGGNLVSNWIPNIKVANVGMTYLKYVL